MSRFYILLIIFFFLLPPAPTCQAQQFLHRMISLEVSRKPLSEALNQLGQQGNFRFSYNSNLLPGDSLVSLSVYNKTVKQTLDILFEGRFEYRETGNHIIIQQPTGGQVWYLSGYVLDEKTGERIRDASVYETQQLVATLTNEQGYFRLRLKDKYPTAAVSIRKAWYTDTFMILKPGYDQELTVSIAPRSFLLDTIVVSPVEKNWLSNLFLSSRQRAQSINLSKFFVDRPYQTSLTPGIGTHGKMSSHVINKFSFNIIGGYTAGLQGVEIGGVFNIVKQDMSFLQIAGVFNMTGGKANGVQTAGVFNHALDSVNGLQLAGVVNFTTGNLRGVQTSGLANHASGSIAGMQLSGAVNSAPKGIKGMQLSGLGNLSEKNVNGMQLSGAVNISTNDVKGVQMSGLLNIARKVNGVQIGIINIADTVEKFNIGLINLIRKGYYKLSLYTNEAVPLNLSLKTGTHKLYNILIAGVNPEAGRQVFTYGYGFGSDLHLWRRWSFTPEITAQYCYRGNPNAYAMLYRANMNLNLKIGKYITFFAGPSFSMYHYSADQPRENYNHPIPKYGAINSGYADLKYWFGWNAGIAFF